MTRDQAPDRSPAVVAREHPRAVGEHAAAAQPGQHRLLAAERDERRVARPQRRRSSVRGASGSTRSVDLAVELDPRAAVAGVERDLEAAAGAGDQRRAAAAVRRERREDEAGRAGREHRPARGERVRARAERRRDDEPVAGEADEQLAVDAHVGGDLARRRGARSRGR